MELQRWILVFVFAAAQLATGSYASELVLCLGDDGHIAVEVAHDVCDGLRMAPAGSLLVSTHSCHDLPLQISELPAVGRASDRVKQTLTEIPPQLLSSMVAIPSSGPRDARKFNGSSEPPDSSLSSLRCVVLTI